MEIKKLNIDVIRIDGGTQVREQLNNAIVAEYADAIKDGAQFPPVTVFFDGSNYWLADGFHRYFATKQSEIKEITADIRNGTQPEAKWFGIGANTKHGLQRTVADKHLAVNMALEIHPEMSDRAIAQYCGVSSPFVGAKRKSTVNVYSCDNSDKFKTSGTVGLDGKTRHYPPPPIVPPKAQNMQMPPIPFPVAKNNALPTMPPTATPPTIPEPQKPVIKDYIGREVPRHLVERWNRKDEIQSLLSQLSAVRSAIRKAQENNDDLFKGLNFACLIELDNTYTHLKALKPYAVCGMCQGEGCKTCKDYGILGEFAWNTFVPEEIRNTIIAEVAKG